MTWVQLSSKPQIVGGVRCWGDMRFVDYGVPY